MAIKETDIIICGHGSGRPSTKIMAEYFQSRYNSIASNGKHKGIVKVMRLKKMTDEKRKEFHDAYKIILGRNYYSQDKRYYVYKKYSDGYYYSDCSSSYCAALQRIGYDVDLLSTAGIYWSEDFEEVPVKISNGHITNPEVLKVADALLFVGNDPSRPLQIGHVEAVYEINGTKNEAPTTPSTEQSTPVTQQNGFSSYLGMVTASALNVRSGSSTATDVVKVIKTGHLVYVTKVINGWGYIGSGWVSLKYIKQLTKITGRVTATYLNVREKAGADNAVKKIINKNTIVKIKKVNEDGTWGYDTKSKGWVSLKYINF